MFRPCVEIIAAVSPVVERIDGRQARIQKILKRLEQDRLAQVLDKLSTIFGGYSEWGQPIHEVGNVAAFLVSAKNSYMTGTTIEVCGGFNKYL